MKPGDLVKLSLGVKHAYIRKVYSELENQVMTIVEVVAPDVDVPEHLVVLTEEGLKKVYKDHVEVIRDL